MLMPLATVTMIGVLGAVIALVSRWRPPGAALGRGLLGAWGGFVLGAIIGLTVDVVVHDGQYVAIIGHVGAMVGAAWTLRTRRALAPLSTNR